MTGADTEIAVVGTPVGRTDRTRGSIDQFAALQSLPLLGRTRLVDTTMRLVNLGGNVLLFGGDGSGRTAVLHEITRRLQADGVPDVTLVDGAGIVSASELLALSLRELGETVPADETVPHVLARLPLPENASRVIAIDDIEASAAQELFGRWRRHLWRTGAQWVVVGDGEDPTPYLDGGAEAWWEDGVLAVLPLDQPDASKLVARYLELAAVSVDVPQELLRSARGLPRDLSRHARALALERLVERESTAAAPALPHSWAPSLEQSPAYELSVHEAKFMALIRDRAFVSLADPSVMQELRWSYGKAHGVANALVQRGILQRNDAPGDLGRPRVVYSASKSD